MHAGYPHPASHIMSLDASILSSNIEAAWEQSQSHHAMRSAPANHHHHHPEPFTFGYSAAFPQYTLSPTLSSHSLGSSGSSASSASPTSASPMSVSSNSGAVFNNAESYMTMLRKSRMGFNAEMPPEPTCLPTHQLFEFDFPPSPSSPAGSSSIATPPMRAQPPQTLSFSSASPVVASVPSSSTASTSNANASGSNTPNAVKRPSTATTTTNTASTAKKPRTCISTKDFVPPDVTGLSKREARLVKNRAAAFLSRQRKREEFELMEIRVAELEQENQRLQALAEGRTPPPEAAVSPASQKELEELRSQLLAARQREQELTEQIEQLRASSTLIKTESQEPALTSDDGSSSGASTPLLTPTTVFPLSLRTNPKASASLGLMALLCALPSLLASSGNGNNSLPFSSPPITNLELSSDDASLSTSLGALDISFDTAKSSDNKLRVRVHSHTNPNSARKPEFSLPVATASPSPAPLSLNMPVVDTDGESDPLGPFLGSGVGMSMGGIHLNAFGSNMGAFGGIPEFPEFSQEFTGQEGSRRRVRIALKSAPAHGSEGGEWEVELR